MDPARRPTVAQDRPIEGRTPDKPMVLSPDGPSVPRILDANGNRAAEGLRVVEDYLRFSLEDGHLAGWAKRLRHQLADGLSRLDALPPVISRDAAGDPGRFVTTPEESHRPTVASVVRANLKRIQQSLRSLEEWGKMTVGSEDLPFEELRYQLYELESAVERTWLSDDSLARRQLCVLVDAGKSVSDFVSRATALVDAGVDLIQLRDKRVSDQELVDRGRRLMELVNRTSTQIIVNDRPDVARVIGAAGVHLGQDDLRVSEARKILGPHAWVGVSAHSVNQARQAVIDGATYLGLGPTFTSKTKSFDNFPGPELLREVVAEIRIPAFAIGGINLQNIETVLACGVTRVAVGAALWNAESPIVACEHFRRRLATNPQSIPPEKGIDR